MVRERLERRGGRARRGLPRADGRRAPRAAMRRLVAAIPRRPGLMASVGIGPNKLVAKCSSDAEKPAGFVALTREEACERFAAAPRAGCPGIGPKTAERLERARARHDRRSSRADEGGWPSASARASRAVLIARATSRTTGRSTPSASPCPSRARRPSRPTSPTRRARGGPAQLTGSSARHCARAAGAGARSRSRSASTTSRPSRAPARSRRRPTSPRWSSTSRGICSGSTRRTGPSASSAYAWRARGHRGGAARRTVPTPTGQLALDAEGGDR